MKCIQIVLQTFSTKSIGAHMSITYGGIVIKNTTFMIPAKSFKQLKKKEAQSEVLHDDSEEQITHSIEHA